MMEKLLPYLTVFAATLVVTLLLTPLVRGLHRRWGMVDKPDSRRINKVPIPRGGGMAIVLGVLIPYQIFHFISGRPWIQGLNDVAAHRMAILAVGIALLGLADDRFSLRPRFKLLGQVVLATLAWAWAGLGFSILWPSLPAWLDGILTVFWIVGAINAFNLIDGMDGLASGISLIAVVGMGGSLFFTQNPQANLFYFALAGGLLGFLFYNWHPASVFLGDSGSMFLGFVVSTLPLASQEPNSFLVSVGIPLLAMGVPIFDTALAILRRTLRRFLVRGHAGEVMSADSDHLHHRILRSVGLNQRKAAMILYGLAAVAVGFGLVAASLQSRSGGLWIVAFAVAVIVMFKDSYIELFEAGRVLNKVAHSRGKTVRRVLSRIAVPSYVVMDVLVLVSAYMCSIWSDGGSVTMRTLKVYLPIRVASIFLLLVAFRTYRTLWSRAMPIDYLRIFAAAFLGTLLGSAVIYYWPTVNGAKVVDISVVYMLLGGFGLVALRLVRHIVRDLFYSIDCLRLRNRRDVSRILVYGVGLRYRAFRRELVRRTAANGRIIVGILDDDILIKGRSVGDVPICGTLHDAPEVINRLNVDSVVIACEITEERLRLIKSVLKPTGVKISHFVFSEIPLAF